MKSADILATFNYVANFFLYCLCGSYFRQQVLATIRCHHKRGGSRFVRHVGNDGSLMAFSSSRSRASTSTRASFISVNFIRMSTVKRNSGLVEAVGNNEELVKPVDKARTSCLKNVLQGNWSFYFCIKFCSGEIACEGRVPACSWKGIFEEPMISTNSKETFIASFVYRIFSKKNNMMRKLDPTHIYFCIKFCSGEIACEGRVPACLWKEYLRNRWFQRIRRRLSSRHSYIGFSRKKTTWCENLILRTSIFCIKFCSGEIACEGRVPACSWKEYLRNRWFQRIRRRLSSRHSYIGFSRKKTTWCENLILRTSKWKYCWVQIQPCLDRWWRL